MIRRISLLIHIDRRFLNHRTRLNATQMANQRMGVLRSLGHIHCTMRPGSAVVPCRTCKVLALTHTAGNHRLAALTSLQLSSFGTVTSIFHGLMLVQGLAERTPG